MNGVFGRWVSVVALSVVLAALARAEGIDVTVVTLEGDEQADKLIAVSEAGVKLEGGRIAQKDIAEVRFPGADAPTAAPVFYLRNGDTLKAGIVSGDDVKFKLKSAALGDLEIENKFLRAIIFPIKDGPSADALEAFAKGAPPKEDQLLLPKGDTLSGFMEKFTDKNLSFNAGGQARTYQYDQVAGFRLAPLDEYKPPAEFRGTVVLRDGSNLTGKLISLKDRVLLMEAINGKQWKIPMDAPQSIQFKGGKLAYVSDLQPKAVDEKPYAGGMPVVYRWRKDRSVTGEKLTVGAKVHPRGIGVHSYSKLTYDLGGQYLKLLGEVALDAASSPNATAAWKIVVDGKEVAAGTAKAAEKSQPIKVDLKEANQLDLICDYGPDDDDAGDHLDWANLRLIKP
jgi:hypothetical protein